MRRPEPGGFGRVFGVREAATAGCEEAGQGGGVKDYWERNSWFVRGFESGSKRLRALAVANGVPGNLPSLPLATASGNGEPSEQRMKDATSGEAPRPGLTAHTTGSSSFPLDFDETMQSRSHHLAGSATDSDEGSIA